MPVLQAIRTLGPNAGATVPIIKKLLKDEEDPLVRCNALLALGSIGPAAVDALIIGLEDPFHMNKSLAAECLARLGTAAAKALPALEAAADSPNESISARMRSSMNLIREGSK
jgi:HEAT repeat protein